MPHPPPHSTPPVRSCVLRPLSNNETALFLTGAWQGQWQLTLLPLPLPNAPVPLQRALRIPHCGPARPCLALGGLAFDGAHFFLALEQKAGLVLVKGTVRGWQVTLSAPVEALGVGPRVNALAADPFLGAVFLAFCLPDRPSELYKVNATTLVVYGIKKMRTRGGAEASSPADLGLVLVPRH